MLHSLFVPACLVTLAPFAAPGDALAPALQAALEAAAAGERLPACVVMADQPTLHAMEDAVRGLHGRERRAALADWLRARAATSQAGVRARLEAAVAEGRAARVEPLWMGNALLCEAEPALLLELAALPGVARVTWLPPVDPASLRDGAAAAPAPPPAALAGTQPEPNLAALQAPALWDLGHDGAGVLVASLDTGLDVTHPDLEQRVWSNPGELPGNGLDDDGNGYVDDLHGWDFIQGDGDLGGLDPHGTHASGIVCGDGTGGALRTGMAPGATLLACAVSGEGSYWLAQQYALAAGADVVTSSLSFKWAFNPKPDYAMHRQLATVELAAGIVHVNSIGNSGLQPSSNPVPFNVAAPGNCPGPFAHPDLAPGGRASVLGVGAIRLPDDAPVSTSSKGPSAWEPMLLYSLLYPWPQDPAFWDYPVGGFGGPLPGLVKPDLCGYAEVQTTSPGGGYATFGGTSAATPHVAGAVALLRQVQPHAEPRHLAAALELTAADLGPAGKDNQFGAGKPQVLDAARRLLLLGRLDDTAPVLGQDVMLEVFGPGGAPVYAYLGTALADSASGWNLAGLQLFWGLLVLPPDGRLALPLAIPDLTPLLGLSLWLQFGTPAGPPGWGSGPLISPPEPLTAAG